MNRYTSRFSPIPLQILACFLILAGCKVPRQAQEPGADPNFHLYLLVGQSNMAGRGAPDAASKSIHPRVMMLDKQNQWVPATDPLHFDKPAVVGVGPGFTFGQILAEKAPKKVRIGLIPCAVGGSSIEAWQQGGYDQPTKTHPYDEALARARAAQQSGVIKGIIWHQGESDSSPDKAAAYLPKLISLIAAFRRELGQAQLPFVAGELGYYQPAYQAINRQLAQLPGQVPHTAVVSAEGLNHKGDITHFDTPSARELGRRYAAAMIRLQAR
jgi:hypothetical protein